MSIMLPFRLASASVCAVAAVVAAQASATGVPAGTVIENTARATYSNNGTPQTIDSNTVAVTVNEILDVAIVSQDSGPVSAQGSTVLTFAVTNTGNAPESFALTADPAVAGNDVDGTVDSLAFDSNGNGAYDDGIDVKFASGGSTTLLAPETPTTIFVLVTEPIGTSDGATSRVKLLAKATTGTGTPGTVFAGAGEGGTDAVVSTSGGDDEDFGSIIASSASLKLVKAATIADPFGGTQPVPGATITYTIVAEVTGSGALANVRVTDAIPNSTRYNPGTLKLGGAMLTDSADTDAGQAASSGVAVDFGTVPAGASRSISFSVTVLNN